MEVYIWHNDWELNVLDKLKRGVNEKIKTPFYEYWNEKIKTPFYEYWNDKIRVLSAFYGSIKIVASAVVGATFALAIRKDFTLNIRVGLFAFIAVFLALLCSFESRRLDEDENVQASNKVLLAVVVLALVIAVFAVKLGVKGT